MRHTSIITTQCNRTLVPHRAPGVLSRWWREYRLRGRRKATAFTLHGLSDRTLKDIGLDRSEIESAVQTIGNDRWPRRGEDS